MANSFLDKLKIKWSEGKFVCIGLDSPDFKFNQSIIDATIDLVCAYKPNSAFYESTGASGLESLQKTIKYINQKDPGIPVILDAKRGDIGNTNKEYVKAIFDNLGADAVTVNPYLGKESLQPFLDRADKGIFILVKTSNEGAGEFQDLEVEGQPLYQVVSKHVKNWGSNVAVVVGATFPEELKKVREIIGDEIVILIPGVGAQGGDLENSVKAAINTQGAGFIISSSRGIIFADNPK